MINNSYFLTVLYEIFKSKLIKKTTTNKIKLTNIDKKRQIKRKRKNIPNPKYLRVNKHYKIILYKEKEAMKRSFNI